MQFKGVFSSVNALLTSGVPAGPTSAVVVQNGQINSTVVIWYPGDVTPADNVIVFQIQGQATGRWRAAGTTDTPPTYTLGLSTGLPSAVGMADGTLAYVQSQKTNYRVELSAFVRTPMTSASFLNQGTWHLNPNGTADGDGLTAATAITPQEFFARVGVQLASGGTFAQPTNIFLHGGDGVTFPIEMTGPINWDTAGPVTIQGDIIPIGGTGAVTAATVRNQATGQTARVTIVGFTYTPGQYLQRQSDLAMFPILADLGAGVAEVGPGYAFDPTLTALLPTELNPAIADVMQPVDFTSITNIFQINGFGGVSTAAGANRLVVQFLKFSAPISKAPSISAPAGRVILNCCVFNTPALSLVSRVAAVINCANKSGSSYTVMDCGGGGYNVFGGINLDATNLQFNGLALIGGGFTTLGTLNFLNGYKAQVQNIQIGSTASAGRILLQINGNSTVDLFNAVPISFNVTAAGIIIATITKGNLNSRTNGTWISSIVPNGTQAALPFVIGSRTAIETFDIATHVFSAAVNVTLTTLDNATPGGFGGKLTDMRGGSEVGRTDVS